MLDDDERQNLTWRKARHSSGNGACVEIAASRGRIIVRDSKDPIGPILFYSAEAWRSFLPDASSDGSESTLSAVAI
jgi:hypothetical protein